MKIVINNMRLNYEVRGEGKTILFLHGFGLHLNSLKKYFEPLFNSNSNFKRVYLDLPGMGDSGYTKHISTTDDVLNTVEKFIDEVIDGEFIIVGESYGAYLAQAICYKKKFEVLSLLMISPIVIAAHQDRLLPSHKVLKKDEEYYNELSDYEKVMYSFCVIQTKEVLERTKREIILETCKSNWEFLSTIEVGGYPLTFEKEMLNATIEVKALTILGRYDSITGYQDALDYDKRFTNGEVILVENAGHNLRIEQSDIFENHFNNWIKTFK